ncbi:MAG: J domain-containing protein [Archangium sp.]
MSDDDLYALLRVPPDADARDIKKAYFGLVRQFPPETHPEEFQKIRAAYDTLSNPEARKAYDLSRSKAAEAGLRDELAAIMRGAIEAMEAREFDRAVPLLRGVVNERPDAEEARGRLCACLLNLERHAEALDDARAFEKHHPDRSLAVLFRAYALRGLDRDVEARAAFIRAGELDPLDFRPVRGVVDIAYKRNEVGDALRYLDERLRDAAESIRLPLQFERISTLFALKNTDAANQALDALEAAAKTEELQEELQWFYEREAAGLFARREAATADAMLDRLRKKAPARPSLRASQQRTVPISALPESAVNWLAQQLTEAEYLCVPTNTQNFRTVITIVLGCLSSLCFAVASASTSSWGPDDWFGAMFACAILAATCWSLRAWWRSWSQKLPNMLVLHRMAMVEVVDDEVRIFPLVRMARTNAMHHSNTTGYTHTAFSLVFGDRWLQFNVAGQQRAEQIAEALGGLRMRMLDLMHSGLLGGDVGFEFFPADDSARSRRNWRPALLGAGVGLVFMVACAFSAERVGHARSLAEARGTVDPAALRALLRRFANDDELAPIVRETLERRRKEAATRLATASPQLSAALLAVPGGQPLKVKLTFDGQLDTPAFEASAFTFTKESVALVTIREREELLARTLQSRVDELAGNGWVTFSRQAGSTELRIDYRLTLGTARYLFHGTKTRDTAWAEPIFLASIESGRTHLEARGAPLEHVRPLPASSDSIAHGNLVNGTNVLIDSAWNVVIEDTAAVVGLRDD